MEVIRITRKYSESYVTDRERRSVEQAVWKSRTGKENIHDKRKGVSISQQVYSGKGRSENAVSVFGSDGADLSADSEQGWRITVPERFG